MFEKLYQLYEAAENWIEKHKIHKEILKLERGKRKILLVSGHNSRRPGACTNGDKEHTICKDLVDKAYHVLINDGFTVFVCPPELSLDDKIDFTNKYFSKEDLLISVHMNAGISSVSGCEVWYQSFRSENRRNAKVISEIISKTLRINNREVRGDLQNHHGSLGILRGTITQEDYLLEMGFITNSGDVKAVREKGVQALVDAVKAAFYW